MATPNDWITVIESNFTWEREALAFIHERFPGLDRYDARSNFEFIVLDGSINEVDLLAFGPVDSRSRAEQVRDMDHATTVVDVRRLSR